MEHTKRVRKNNIETTEVIMDVLNISSKYLAYVVLILIFNPVKPNYISLANSNNETLY